MTDKDYKYYLNEAISKTNEGKIEEALELLDKSIDLKPDNALSYFSKAICHHNLNQLRAAYENYSKAIEFDEKMIDAYYNKAQAVLAYENPTEEELALALKDLEIATELDEKFIDAHYYSAVIKKKLKDYEGAIASLDKVLAIEPKAVYSNALKKLILQKYLNK